MTQIQLFDFQLLHSGKILTFGRDVEDVVRMFKIKGIQLWIDVLMNEDCSQVDLDNMLLKWGGVKGKFRTNVTFYTKSATKNVVRLFFTNVKDYKRVLVNLDNRFELLQPETTNDLLIRMLHCHNLPFSGIVEVETIKTEYDISELKILESYNGKLPHIMYIHCVADADTLLDVVIEYNGHKHILSVEAESKDIDIIIRQLYSFITLYDPDFIVGYHIFTLLGRNIQLHPSQAFLKTSRTSTHPAKIIKELSSHDGVQYWMSKISIPGRVIFDLFEIVRRDEPSLKQYDLGTVANTKNPGVEHVRQVVEMFDIIDGYMCLSNICHCPLSTMFHKGRTYILENLAKWVSMKTNTILTKSKLYNKTCKSAGGVIINPKKGLYNRPVLVFDFRSYYPSIMITYNVNHNIPKIRTKSNFLGTLTKHVLSYRLKFLDNSKIKIILNSIYGQIGVPYSLLYNPKVFQNITTIGRMVHEQIQNYIETKYTNITLVYGDTDSFMFAINNGTDAMKLGYDIKEHVNRQFENKIMHLKYEGYFKNMLIFQKKKYFGTFIDSQKPHISKRVYKGDGGRTTSPICIRTCRNFINELLNGKNLKEALQKITQECQTILRFHESYPLRDFVMFTQLRSKKTSTLKKVALKDDDLHRKGYRVSYIAVCQTKCRNSYELVHFKKKKQRIDIYPYLKYIYNMVSKICYILDKKVIPRRIRYYVNDADILKKQRVK